MKIAIVDDIEAEVRKIDNLLNEYSGLRKLEIQTKNYRSAEDFLSEFSTKSFDLVFLDIYMDGMNGVEAAQEISRKDSDVLIVFLTTSPDHMQDAFRIHAFDYLAKPVEKNRFFGLMNDVQARLIKKQPDPVLTFISQRNEISLYYSEIVTITSLGNYLEIGTKSGNVYKTRMTFSVISEQLLQDHRFLIINRGVLVNMDFVIDISEKCCTIPGGIQFPVNTREYKKLRQTWLNYSIAQIRKESLERGPH